MRKTPVVLGVLSIIFGALAILWNGASLAMLGVSNSLISGMQMQAAAGQPDPQVFVKRALDLQAQLMPVYYTNHGGMIALSVALLVIGIGLVKRQGWSRRASMAWALAALLFLPVRIYLEVAVVLPRTQTLVNDTMMASQRELMGTVAEWQKVLSIVLPVIGYAPFPILLLLLMGRRSARNDLFT
jgi:hypothetical protein